MNKEVLDIKRKSTVIALFASLLMLSSSLIIMYDVSEAYGSETGGSILFDMGNGVTSWHDIVYDGSEPTIGDVLESTADANGYGYDYSNNGNI